MRRTVDHSDHSLLIALALSDRTRWNIVKLKKISLSRQDLESFERFEPLEPFQLLMIESRLPKGENMHTRGLIHVLIFAAAAFLLPVDIFASEADLVLPDLTTESFQGIS